MFQIFIRNWWIVNKQEPDGLEPGPGKKQIVGFTDTLEEAFKWVQEYNEIHSPGKLSRKAQFIRV